MAEQQKVNVNTASRDELKQIEGVGDSLADEIVQYREQHGQFNNVEDLDQVWRLSGEELDRVRKQITC